MTRSTRSTARTLALVMLVVLAGITSPMVGSAAASGEWTDGNCTGTELVLTNLYPVDIYEYVTGKEVSCSASTSDTMEEMQEDQADLTRTNILSAASAQNEQRQSFLATLNNYNQDSRSVAFSKGEAAAVAALENGSTLSEAQKAFNQSVEAYYASKQMALIRSWEITRTEMQYHTAVVRNDSNIKNTYVAGLINNTAMDNQYYYEPLNATGLGTQDSTPSQDDVDDVKVRFTNASSGKNSVNLSLVNGSSVSVPSFEYSDDQGDIKWVSVNTGYYRIESSETGTSGPYYRIQGLVVNGSEAGDKDLRPMLPLDEYAAEWSDLQQSSRTVKQNGAPYVESLYNARSSDNVNLSDYVSASTLAQEYAMDYNSTGHYSFAWAMMSQAGMNVANLENTSKMTVRDESSGFEYTGMLFSQGTPSSTDGTWVVNETYNTSKIDGLQIVITDESDRVEITGNFTITQVKNASGGNVSSVQAQRYHYRANNVSEYKDLQKRLMELQEEIQEQEPGAGGGGPFSGWTPAQKAVGGAAGLVVVIRLLAGGA